MEIASLKETPEELTIEATVRFTGTPPSGRNMVAVSSDSQSYGLWGYAPLAGITWVESNNAAHVAQSAWNQFPTGQALRLAGVVARGQTRLFVNGKLAPGSSKVQPFLGYFRAGALIGGELTKDGTPMTFQGVIDEVRISNSARYDSDYRVVDRLTADSQTLALYHFDEAPATS